MQRERVAQALVAIVGPTCTGKTRLAVALARRLWPAELINADSRQLRRGLRVGTCAPTAADLGEVPCHLLDEADPGDDYTVAHWLAAAVPLLDDLQRRGVQPIVVGGTGLYVTALVEGYDFAGTPPDPATRAERTRLAQTEEGRARLAADVARRDPGAVTALDMRNPRRVIRALEILDGKGRLVGARQCAPRQAVRIGLDAPRARHHAWIESRCGAMFRSGAILEETRRALEGGRSRGAVRASGIGYAEALDVLDGRRALDDAVAAATRRTVRYAKAQLTYLRRDHRIHWLDASQAQDVLVRAALDIVDAVARSLGHEDAATGDAARNEATKAGDERLRLQRR